MDTVEKQSQQESNRIKRATIKIDRMNYMTF